MVVGFVALASCGHDPCENIPLSESVSPDGRKKIVIFSRECGVTTGRNCQGSIIGVSDPQPIESGTLFITDGEPAEVRSDSAKRVTVTLAKGGRVFKPEELVEGVAVENR